MGSSGGLEEHFLWHGCVIAAPQRDPPLSAPQSPSPEKAPTQHIKYGHWGMERNATEQHQIQRGPHTLCIGFKVYFVLVSLPPLLPS